MKKSLALLLTLILTFSCFSILSVGTVSAETQKVGQVILESDFNNSDGTNWQATHQNVTFGDDNGDGVNDYASVKIGTKSGAGLVSSPFNLIPGNEYELTYYIRVPEESVSFLIGSTFYAPTTALYQPTVNSAGTKVTSTPAVSTEEASNNYYAYSYTNKDDATKSWARRKGFAATWTIDGYEPTVKSNFSSFSYKDHGPVLSATNTDLNAAFANWTKVTVNFTAMAAAEGETLQVTALGFTFHDHKSSDNFVFDLKDVKLVCTNNGTTTKTIMQSDFNDADGTNWQATQQNVTYGDDNGDGVNDYASVKIGAKNGAGLLSSPFNLIPGNEYELTYYIRVPEGSESFNIGGTFYAPTTIFYQPTVNSAGTKVSSTPAVANTETANNYYAYSYTDKDDATKSWVRREGFKATWTIDGYQPKTKEKFSNFGYADHKSVLSATNADINAAFANWTKVTVNFTAMAAVEGETSQVTALGFTFHDYKSDKNYVFDIKDVVLTETSLQPETPEDPEELEGAVFYENFETATDASVAEFITNRIWAKPKVVNTEYCTGNKSLQLRAYNEYIFIPVDKSLLTVGKVYEFSMDWKLQESTDTKQRKISKLAFVGYNPSKGDVINKDFINNSNGVYTYKDNIAATGDWEKATLRFGNSNYDLCEQYGIVFRYTTSTPYDENDDGEDTMYIDNITVAPAEETTVTKPTLNENERTEGTVKVLALGNSFALDSTAWISQIAKADGKDLRVGYCHIAGCSLQRHYKNIFEGDNDKYSFGYYTSAGKTNTQKLSLQEALIATDWDYITFQQASGSSYDFNTYEPFLTELIAYVKKMCPNAKIVLNETWAYPDDSPIYGSSTAFDTDGDGKCEEAAMFEKVRESYLKASQNHGFTPLIPVGEAILRARDELARNLSRDGHHLDDRGRLIAALMWYETFTGVSALDNKVDLTDNSTFVFSYSTAEITGTSDINGYNGVEYKDTGLNITAEEQHIMKTIAHETVELYKKANEAQLAIENISKVITVKSGEKIENAEALRNALNNDSLLPNLETLESAKAEYNTRIEKIVFPGDIDHTYEEPDAQDVALLAKYFAGWDVKDTVNNKALDVNGDGNENLFDIVVLAQYVAEWENVELYDPNMEEIKGLVDFVVEAPSGKDVSILQLTDTQIIDESKKRYESRVSGSAELTNESAYSRCFKYIKESVKQSNPDLILITGDFIYGEFDDDGEWFSKLVLYMNSLEIPWAPVFGNHDNESMMGVTWQCNMFEKFEENSAYFEVAFSEFKGLYPEFEKFEKLSDMKNYCLFKRGDLTGNGNYSIGIVQDKQLIKTVYMMDTNYCKRAYKDTRVTDENGNYLIYNTNEVDENGKPTVKTDNGFGSDQVDWLNTSSANIDKTLGYTVTKFLGIHIQLNQFWYAAIESGYENDDGDSSNENDYKIGETVTAQNGDFGAKGEKFNGLHGDEALWQILKDNNFDGIFAGHTHKNSTSILYDGIRLTFGLKTGTFDAHSKDSLGGTQITLNGNGFNVEHVYVN